MVPGRPTVLARVGCSALWFAVAAALFWVVESAIDAIGFGEGTVLERLWPDDPQEIWMRIEAILLIGVVTAAMRVANIARMRTDWIREEADRSLRSVVDGMPITIVLASGLDWKIEYANAEAEQSLGLSQENLRGHRLIDFFANRSDLLELYGELVREGSADGVEVQGRRVDGAFLWMRVSARWMSIGDRRLQLVAIEDVTNEKLADDVRWRRERRDSLTDLPNRVLFLERLDRALANSARRGNSVAVLIGDIDNFSEINETLGLEYGDAVLREIGSRWRDVLRDGDTVARIGSDEFAALIVGVKSAAEAPSIASTLLGEAGLPIKVKDETLYCTMSLGMALFPEHSADADTLIRRAHVAMEMAQHSHSGYAIYQPGNDLHRRSRLALIGELGHGLEHNHLFLLYQPQVDATSGKIVAVEALARWQHPEHGTIPPGEFIGLAEESGLIWPLTTWVLDNALAQLSEWHSDGLYLRLSVNVSALNLYYPGFTEMVGAALVSRGIDPKWLRLELTESDVMGDPDRALEVLTELRGLGVGISIDDFGTGYSSLAHLQRLPVDELKIDKSFVDTIKNADDRIIVRSTIELGRSLGLLVVGEGVEDEETWEIMRDLGCHLVQGFHFSPPVPASEIQSLNGATPVARADGANDREEEQQFDSGGSL